MAEFILCPDCQGESNHQVDVTCGTCGGAGIVPADQIPCGPTDDDMYCACGCGGDDSRCNYWIAQYNKQQPVADTHTCCK